MNEAEYTEIKHIIENVPQTEWTKELEESRSYNRIYHLSDIRENLVGFLPVSRADRVLELGCGCGALTGSLARRAGSVTALDTDPRYCELCLLRHKEQENLIVENADPMVFLEKTKERYTMILLVDELKRTEEQNQAKELLKACHEKLTDGGQVVIAVPNRYGLRYFAGSAYPQTESYFTGIDGRFGEEPHTCFSRKELRNLLAETGYQDPYFYYPYPDHHFPLSVFSDDRQPGSGELMTNQLNFDWERFSLFDENRAFEGIREEGSFPYFSNSYLVMAKGS